MFLTERQYSHARIQEFLSGGGGGAENSSYKLVFSLNVLGVQCFFFKENNYFIQVSEGVQRFFVFVFFLGGEGVNPYAPYPLSGSAHDS